MDKSRLTLDQWREYIATEPGIPEPGLCCTVNPVAGGPYCTDCLTNMVKRLFDKIEELHADGKLIPKELGDRLSRVGKKSKDNG
jgi:hypothetical protein